jgi:hypothetical protein
MPCAVRLVPLLFFILVPLTFNLVPGIGHAANVDIVWDPSTGPVAGYEFCYGTSSGSYDYVVDVGNITSCSISGLEEGTTYYFAAKAYDSEGIKSTFSQELVYTVPLSSSGGSGGANNSEILIEAEDMSFHANGAQKGAGWLLWSNGTMSEEIDFLDTGIYRFEIAAKGDLANGVGPEMEVLIDGDRKGTVFVNTETPNIYGFDIEISAGRHNFAIGFINDLYEPSQNIDRNLYVDDIFIYPSPGGVTPQKEDPLTDEPLKVIEIEAENGNLNYPFEYGSDSGASSNGFIWAPNGTGNKRESSNNAGYAEFAFEVPTTGNYVIWGRVLATSRKDNSFYVAVDGSNYVWWNTKRSRSWIWDQVSSQGDVDPVIYHLEVGEHTLTIKQREDGTKIDKILITNDLQYAP